jgi:hypothetical protein
MHLPTLRALSDLPVIWWALAGTFCALFRKTALNKHWAGVRWKPVAMSRTAVARESQFLTGRGTLPLRPAVDLHGAKHGVRRPFQHALGLLGVEPRDILQHRHRVRTDCQR